MVGIPAACHAGQSRGGSGPRGVSNFLGGGAPIFWGAGLQFFGGRGSNFSGGWSPIFQGVSNFSGGVRGHPFLGGEGIFFSFLLSLGIHSPPQKQSQAYGQRAAGAHPTGMHSCYDLLLQVRGSWPPCPPPYPIRYFLGSFCVVRFKHFYRPLWPRLYFHRRLSFC